MHEDASRGVQDESSLRAVPDLSPGADIAVSSGAACRNSVQLVAILAFACLQLYVGVGAERLAVHLRLSADLPCPLSHGGVA